MVYFADDTGSYPHCRLYYPYVLDTENLATLSLLAEKREKEYIENVNQSKLRFFTNVSHEFRTPLTLISSQLEMLLMHKDMIPEVYNKILDIYKNSRRMNNLVDEVIDIRKQDQGYLKLKIS